MNLFNVHSESVSEGRFSEVVLKYLLIVPEVSVTFSFVFLCVKSAGSLQHLALFFASQLITRDTGSSSNIIFSHMGDNNCDLHKAWMPCRVCRMASSLSPARWKKASVCAAKDEGRFAVTAT